MTGTAQDVTEAKEFEERLKQLSLIASESKNGIIILDKFGKVEWVNDGFTKLSGYTLDDIIGTTADILRKGEDTGLKPGSATYETMVKEKKPVIYEAENYTKDGRKYWAQTTLSPLLNEKGEIHKIIAIDSDITQLKKTEKNLIRAKEKAEESKRAKEQFLANMSHEIRTPMNGIIGFAKLLEDSPLTPQQKEYLHAIEASGSNLLVIINDILDLSKMEAGKITFEERKLSITDCINNAMQILKPKIVNNVAFTKIVDSRIPVFLKGDEVRLNQVLINLISNAIKFTEEGEIVVWVKLLNEDEKSVELEFCVHDTGIGIPKSKQEVIFESFAQASNSTTRKYGGTGLGLTISKELVELQGGTMKVESELKKGSDFFFTLKFNKCTASDEEQIESRKLNGKDIKEKSLASVKILLVEDNKLNQLLASKVLEQWNTFPIIATNGKIAIQKLSEEKFDLVLMDIQMPEMDGYEATSYIRTHISKSLPIIAMTANAMAGEKEKCIKAGLNDLIAKPFDPKELYSKIVQYVKV
ncbi:MAG: ATP-binding protein [Bacteroidia bacterium]